MVCGSGVSRRQAASPVPPEPRGRIPRRRRHRRPARHARRGGRCPPGGRWLGGDDPSQALHELARALRQRFMALRDEADLTEAIGLSKKAIASAGAGTHEELTAQLGLAESLGMRLILDPSNDEDRRAAIEIYRRVAHTGSAGLAAQVSASFAWARAAHDGGYLE